MGDGLASAQSDRISSIRIKRAAQIALALPALLYLGDFLVARGRSRPYGSVEVKSYLAVRLKGKKVEYIPPETSTETCVHSLFPQLGYTPCWYLERHKVQRVEVN